MSSLVFRYIAISYIPSLLGSITFFTLFLLTFQFIPLAELVLGNKTDYMVVFHVVWDLAIGTIPSIAPLSIVFSVIYTFNRLSGDAEYTAMRAIGLSKERIFLPTLVMTSFISLNLLVLNYEMVPLSNRSVRVLVNKLSTGALLAKLKPGQFFGEIPRVTLFAEKIEEGGERMKNVFLHLDDPEKKAETVIVAESGSIKNSNGKENSGQWRLTLNKGNMVNLNLKDKITEKIFFEEFDYPVPLSSSGGSNLVRANILTGTELWKVMHMKEAQWQKLGMDKEQFYKTTFVFWNIFNGPLVCLLFALLGFTLGAQINRRTSSNATGLTLLIVVIYYALTFFLMSLVSTGKMSAVLGVFLPSVLLLVVCLWLYRKMEWSE